MDRLETMTNGSHVPFSTAFPASVDRVDFLSSLEIAFLLNVVQNEDPVLQEVLEKGIPPRHHSS